MSWNKNSENLLSNLVSSRKTSGNTGIVLELLKKHKLLKSTKNILSIGAGSGQTEIELMRSFGVQLGYIDPSPSLAAKFHSSMEEEKLENILLEEHIGPFDTFTSKHLYDLAISIHSWYYISTEPHSFQKLTHLLSPRGKALILLTSSTDFSKNLIKNFAPNKSVLNAEDLAERLDNAGIKYNLDPLEEKINFDTYFQKNNFTDYGRKWVSYFLRQDYDDLPKGVQQDLIHFFEKSKRQKATFSFLAFILSK